jgi:hypothetical protein
MTSLLCAIFFGLCAAIFLFQLVRPEHAARLNMPVHPRRKLMILLVGTAVLSAGSLFISDDSSSSIFSSYSGKNLYDDYKSVHGNADTPAYNEQEYLRGKIISTCKVNGKTRGYYGWIEFRTLLIEGERVRNAPTERLYVFVLNGTGTKFSAIWRGKEYKQAVIDDMQQTCD